MSLKNKRILITAGPTWVPIDAVRVISNFASGETGILLAKRLKSLGAGVTLLLGPSGSCSLNKRIKLVRFCFLKELKSRLERELKNHSYDAVIHTAAVSDYQPLKTFKSKIKSGQKRLVLNLEPTPKIINYLKKFAPDLLTVGFKFEPEAPRGRIIKEARTLMQAARLDLVVANTARQNRYRAYIVTPLKVYGSFSSKQSLVRALTDLIRLELQRN